MCYFDKLMNFVSTYAGTLLILSIAILSATGGDLPPIS